MEELINTYKPIYIAQEDFMFSKNRANSATVSAGWRAIIHYIAAKYKLPVEVLGVSAWKKFVCGRTTPTSEQKKKWAKKAKKMMVKESIEQEYGITIPSHILNEATGRVVQFKDDIIESIAMGIYFCTEFVNCEDFDFTVFSERKEN